MLFLNLLPPLILVSFFWNANLTDIFRSLGSGIGIGLVIIILSFVFLKKKSIVGLIFNIILFCFVFIDYFLPRSRFDVSLSSFLIFFVVTVILAWLGIVGSIAVLLYYPLVKKPGNYCRQTSVLSTFYMGIPSYIGGMAPLIAFVAQKKYSLKFSLVFLGWEIFGWVISLLGLYLASYTKKVNMNDVKRFIAKERGFHIPIKRRNVQLVFVLFLGVCTLFEYFRGDWFIWFGILIWISLIFMILWHIWKYVFVSSSLS